MGRKLKSPAQSGQDGVSLIEVLVTVFILAIGLLGLVGLQTRLQTSEMESYQRAQALVLLNDLSSRINNNRSNAVDYVGMDCISPPDGDSISDTDIREWCSSLQGAAEQISESQVGAMVGEQGCVEQLGDTENDEYLVTIAWQGLAPVSAPPESVSCGKGDYDSPSGKPCRNDLCRRVVTTVIRIAELYEETE